MAHKNASDLQALMHLSDIPAALLTFLGFAALAAPCVAQELEFPISPNPVGSGARAAGMANAFVAVADDATAASWNPAGLVQLERPELSVVGSFNGITEWFNAAPEVVGFGDTHRDANFDLNFMSAVYPVPWTMAGRNATVSLSFQQKYDLSRQFRETFSTQQELPFGSVLDVNDDTSFMQDGGLSVITPAFSFEITKSLSIGLAVNLWRDNPFGDGGWEQTLSSDVVTFLDGSTQPNEEFQRTVAEEYQDLSGENFSIGVLWNATDRLNLGFRYDTRLGANADFSRTVADTRPGQSAFTSERRELHIPSVIAAGASYRFNDRFTFSLDVTTADWNGFFIETEAGSRISLVDAHDLNDPTDPTRFDRTFTVRFGAEYVFIPEILGETLNQLWTLRGGIYFDQEPASGRPTDDPSAPGDGNPDAFYGFTIGAGVLIHQHLNLDFAYELRYGNGVNRDFVRGLPGFEEDVLQHRVLLSAVVYF